MRILNLLHVNNFILWSVACVSMDFLYNKCFNFLFYPGDKILENPVSLVLESPLRCSLEMNQVCAVYRLAAVAFSWLLNLRF